MKTEDTEALRR